MSERAVTLPNGCEQHGLPAYRDDAGTVHIATGARCIGPDAERDERVRLRRAVDARRAGIALDALLARRDFDALMAQPATFLWCLDEDRPAGPTCLGDHEVKAFEHRG